VVLFNDDNDGRIWVYVWMFIHNFCLCFDFGIIFNFLKFLSDHFNSSTFALQNQFHVKLVFYVFKNMSHYGPRICTVYLDIFCMYVNRSSVFWRRICFAFFQLVQKRNSRRVREKRNIFCALGHVRFVCFIV